MTEPRYFPLTGFPEAWTPSTDGMVLARPVYVGDKTPGRSGRPEGRAPWRPDRSDHRPQYEFITEDRLQPATSDERVPTGAPRSIRSRAPVGSRETEPPSFRKPAQPSTLRPNIGQHGTIFVLGNRNTADDAVPSIVMASEHYNMIVRMLEAGEDVRAPGGNQESLP